MGERVSEGVIQDGRKGELRRQVPTIDTLPNEEQRSKHRCSTSSGDTPCTCRYPAAAAAYSDELVCVCMPMTT